MCQAILEPGVDMGLYFVGFFVCLCFLRVTFFFFFVCTGSLLLHVGFL